jgi:hypothetical protein
MGPKQPRSTVPTPEEEVIIVAFRRHTLLPLDDCLYGLQPTIPHLTRSSLRRCLERHGTRRLPDGRRQAREEALRRSPRGYMHIDIAEVRTEEGKLDLFVAIDRTSKLAFAKLEAEANRYTASDVLRALTRRRDMGCRCEGAPILLPCPQPSPLGGGPQREASRSCIARRSGGSLSRSRVSGAPKLSRGVLERAAPPRAERLRSPPSLSRDRPIPRRVPPATGSSTGTRRTRTATSAAPEQGEGAAVEADPAQLRHRALVVPHPVAERASRE